MRSLAVSQPMFFPWPGLFEQARLADMFLHYDDAQLPQGRSLVTRVKIKTPIGPQWLSAPVLREAGQQIRRTRLDRSQDWRSRTLKTLRLNYARAPFVEEMTGIVEEVLRMGHELVCDLNVAAFERICRYFGIWPKFGLTSETLAHGSGSERLLNLCRALQADVYVTGHGARAYLDHEAFERAGIEVRYMDYERAPFPQLWGAFDPHVSVLDLIANQGQRGASVLRSGSLHWRHFLHEELLSRAA
jgi:hypothetical protein